MNFNKENARDSETIDKDVRTLIALAKQSEASGIRELKYHWRFHDSKRYSRNMWYPGVRKNGHPVKTS
jgi:hypothetical protein